MKQNDFYEVDGCTDFIPVTINETYADGVGVIVSDTMRDYRLLIEQVYRFPKVKEPQKVVVPKFIAEWIEECKRSGWHLQKVLSRLDDDEKVGDWAYDENDDLVSEKVDMIARAWLDGYEIEKEKLYIVEIPNPHSYIDNHSRLARNYKGKVVLEVQDWLNTFDSYKLTEAEIKEDFEWAWQWAKEVE